MTHGGFRKGSGRRPHLPETIIRVTVRLTPEQVTYVLRRGHGYLSEGIRAVIDECRQAGSDRPHATEPPDGEGTA